MLCGGRTMLRENAAEGTAGVRWDLTGISALQVQWRRACGHSTRTDGRSMCGGKCAAAFLFTCVTARETRSMANDKPCIAELFDHQSEIDFVIDGIGQSQSQFGYHHCCKAITKSISQIFLVIEVKSPFSLPLT